MNTNQNTVIFCDHLSSSIDHTLYASRNLLKYALPNEIANQSMQKELNKNEITRISSMDNESNDMTGPRNTLFVSHKNKLPETIPHYKSSKSS